MSDNQEYPDLFQEVRGALHPGKLKLQSTSVVFRNIKTGKVDHYQSTEIDKFQWLKRARGFCLKLTLENETIQRYDGFKEPDFEKLSSFISKNYHTSLEKVDLSVKGWNWGAVKFKGNSLNFEVDNSLAFEVPLGNVSHTTSLKNEVTVEFHQNDDAAVSLMELRFHIPGDAEGPVKEFYQNVVAKADIIQLTGDAIVTFSEVHCLTPRGRYDVKMFTSYIQLHGKTFDYKIPISSVLRLFLLPHKDGRQMFFVVSLDPPIKQGQTRYPFLILLFNKDDDEIAVDVTLSPEDLEKKYEGKLSETMSGPNYEVISRVFKAIINRKITVPGSYVGRGGSQAISCSYKAATGFLYPLERGFIFVHKPPIHIRFDEVLAVNFARSAGSTRSFDFDVETKAGTLYTFVGIEKEEYGKLYDFVAQKKLRVKNIGGGLPKQGKDDDDMFESEEEDTHDAYMVRMKAEGKEREDDDDESDDSSDESFNPGESGSEVAEEYDSNPTTTADSDSDFEGDSGSDSGSEAERRREKKEKKEKKQKSKSAKTVREGKPRERKKKKKDVDPDKPKRPQSAYFLWLNEHREQIKSENPGISITEISKKAGEMWKQVTDKSEWDKKAEEAKKEYQIAIEKYKEKAKDRGDMESPPSRKKSPKKSPKKVVDSRAGAGGDYKSKEFISSSESSSDEDKPLRKKPKKESRKEKKAESEEDKLPDDEDILSTPPSSGKDDEESESGSDD